MSTRFDAATDRLSHTASSPPSPATSLTITAWAYVSVDRDDFSTFSRLHSSSGASTVLTWATSSDGTSGPNYFTGGGSVSNGTGFVVGAWRKIAVSCSGTTATSYVATVGGSTEVDSGTVSTSAPTGITLGGRSPTDATEWFNGRLAYVRVFGGTSVLTQAEIEAEWASTTPVRTADLWADWPLTDSTDLTDHSGNGHHLAAGSTAVSTEADPPLGHTLVLGRAVETSTAAALIRSKNLIAGRATEASSAAALARVKRLTLGRSVATSSAATLARGKNVLLTRATETESAGALSRAKQLVLARAVEADTAAALNVRDITVTVAPAPSRWSIRPVSSRWRMGD
ncbi:MAG TPA: LamG-like jellyroll fold domain-containing protein [Amycolatopsis sp.]|uniref:LamG-like jellyroll fold domain-containing protein n=1 Tax=Amycolatopsis sp. TaxID=37632 RepID=UPI002B4A115B|nr:LamG-like jellyroll fold domain-containing protein [Amycolatopsis sp.]HKS46368.1 LamG-like jellyroll fold domain-containing protein [Amycolatopsis sp.]